MFSEFLEAWSNPITRHAMVIHFPVVLSLVGIPFAVLAAVWHRKPRGAVMRWIALAMFVALTLGALAARNSGHDAEEAVEGSLSEAGHEELEAHEHHGHNLWLWPAGISALIGVSFVNHRLVRLAATGLAIAASLLTAERIAHTAHHGGRLVFTHGAGRQDESLAALLASAAEPGEDPRLSHFRQQVRPILVESCFRCHNARKKKRAGGLDQTTIAGLLEGGWSGPAIVPGRPDESLLVQVVRWEIKDVEMPAGGDKLPDDQIQALAKWIADGAVWEPFEYTPPEPSG